MKSVSDCTKTKVPHVFFRNIDIQKRPMSSDATENKNSIIKNNYNKKYLFCPALDSLFGPRDHTKFQDG